MKAFLIIDMLKDFVRKNGKLEVPKSREIIQNIQEKLEKQREKNNLIIYVADRHREKDKEFKNYPPHAIAGTEGAEIIKELEPKKNEIVINKRRFSAFYGTDLDLTLREKDIKKLTITGILTNICVLYTAADAKMREYEVSVPRDSVATNEEKTNEFALKQMKEVLGVNIT